MPSASESDAALKDPPERRLRPFAWLRNETKPLIFLPRPIRLSSRPLNHLGASIGWFLYNAAIPSVFEKDRWYLRPWVRSGSLIPPFCIRFGRWWLV